MTRSAVISGGGGGEDGGNHGYYEGGGGGGGSYGTAGSNGGSYVSGGYPGYGATTLPGSADLSKLLFGGGGGGGGGGDSHGGTGGTGGVGGGIVYVSGTTINVSGGVRANGAVGTTYSGYGGGGGGGAGGSVLLEGGSLSLSSGLVTTTYGAGANGVATADGGNGGYGRVAVVYEDSVTGSTSPAANTSASGYNTYGVYTSPAIPTPNAQTYGKIQWSEELETYGNISVQTRSGSSATREKGLDFEGYGDYLDAGSNYNFTSSDFTISAWIKPEGVDVDGIILWGNGAYNNFGYYLLLIQSGDDMILRFRTAQSGASQHTDSDPISANEWQFISVVRDGATATIYKDGVDITSSHGTHVDPATSSYNFAISGYTTTSNYSYPGQMDEIRIWDDARTPSEITSNMNNELTGVEANLVGYWKLDEMSGTTAYDSSSSGVDLSINGDVSWREFYDWESWKPFESTTNYSLLESADTHTNWVGTNATVAEAETSSIFRNVPFFEEENEFTGTNITKITSSTSGGYAEATISSTDLTNYDYLTAWVRASQVGTTLRLGFGEVAATEQTEDIVIDEANEWQKVYWDISDIADSSKNNVTKLRLTNLSGVSNTIYLDNVRAELLSNNNEGSVITSTPDDYLQYRTIFTTTNPSYRPLLENISFTYNSGYRIVHL